VEACDFGAISMNPATKLAEMCDQCETLEEGPQCVKWCPKEALFITTPDQRAQKSRRDLIKEEIVGTKAAG
jgi:Fe-S-cluster-containing hydrogenase component 2